MLGCLWGTSGHFSLQQDRKRNKWKCRNTKPQICQDFHSTQPEWLLCGCYDKHCRLFWNINTLAADSMSCLRWPQRTRQPHITTWPLARLTNLYHGHSWWNSSRQSVWRKASCPRGKRQRRLNVVWREKHGQEKIENVRFHLWNPGKTMASGEIKSKISSSFVVKTKRCRLGWIFHRIPVGTSNVPWFYITSPNENGFV